MVLFFFSSNTSNSIEVFSNTYWNKKHINKYLKKLEATRFTLFFKLCKCEIPWYSDAIPLRCLTSANTEKLTQSYYHMLKFLEKNIIFIFINKIDS